MSENNEKVRVVGTLTKSNVNGGIAIILIDLTFNNKEEADRFISKHNVLSTLEIYPALNSKNETTN